MIKYYRTNVENPTNVQAFYIIDKTGRIVNVTSGIAEKLPEILQGIFKNGERLFEVSGDDYDHAVQRYLKEQP